MRLLFLCLLFSSCSTVSSLKFTGEYILPDHLQFENTVVGGLSGIDYDKDKDIYYLISDDRSSINPARFYTAQIKITTAGISSVNITGVQTLLQQNGLHYPPLQHKGGNTPDPEAIRYNPGSQQLYWSSEGERIVKNEDTVLIDPAITIISKEGKYIDTIPLPYNLRMQAIERGPVRNSVLEGLTFADHYKTLYASLERPLYEDGSFTRIYKFNVADKKNTMQYRYKLDSLSGITDILAVNKHQLLVTERYFADGFRIKVFLTRLHNKKKLLLDMQDLHRYIDNIEGATFGPVLANGHRTLIFVADNNFQASEKTQFLLFEVMP